MENTALAAASPFGVEGDAGVGSALSAAGRSVQGRLLAAEADRLRWALEVWAECRAEGPQVLHGSELESFVRSLAETEIAATLGVSLAAAGHLLALAQRVSSVMPGVLS